MDSTDYYERYGNAYFEETVNLSMEDILEEFAEYLPENAEVLDLGCGSGRDTLWLEKQDLALPCWMVPCRCAGWQRYTRIMKFSI